MSDNLRKTGIEVLGEIPWGTHFCQFYDTKEDLIELLIPYFKAGLENNEFCLWITADPISTEDAFHALKKAVPDLDQHIEKGSMEIISYMNWYLKSTKFNGKLIGHAWIDKLDGALARGYDGMRVNGNETWLKPEDREHFMEYEENLNNLLRERPIIALCTYSLSRSNAETLLDVVHAHEWAITKRKGHWEILEAPTIKKLKNELKRKNDELEMRVAERTTQLARLIEQLKIEIGERQKAEDYIKRQVELSHEIIDAIPTMSWCVLPDGRLDFMNRRWLDYAGLSLEEAVQEPMRIIHPDDLARVTENWIANRTAGTSYDDEMRLRRSDGQYRWFLVRTAPLRDQQGTILKWYGVSIDIEDSKRAQDELRLAYQRLSYHVENTPLAVIEWDRDLLITRWSGQAEKIFGWKAQEALGKNIYDPGLHLICEEDQQQVEEIANELMNGIVDRNLSLNRNYTKDGQLIYCEWYNSALRDEQGNVITILSLTHNVTERKEAEDALRKSEDQLRMVIDTIPIMAWSISAEGVPDFVNKQWLDYTGLSLEDQRKNPNQPIHPEDLPLVLKSWEKSFAAGDPVESEMRVRRADGKYRWFLARTDPLRDEKGNIIRWYGVAIDINASKQAENKLRMAYQRLSYHVENTPLAVIEWDKDLNITRWSEQAEKIFEWKASEVLGINRYDPDFPIVYKEDEEKVAKIDYELVNGLVDRNFSVNRNYTKNGKVIYCEWYNSVLRDEEGNVVTILSLTHDVTQRKEAEEKLNQSYDQIRSLSEHLQSIREEERKYIAREIHDELGQYLTVLKMDVGFLSKKLPGADAVVHRKLEQLSDLTDKIVHSVRRLASELRPSLLDDVGLVAAIEWHLKEFENRSGIRTHFRESEEEFDLPEPVKTNLFRIVQESLTNVVRHSKATEVKVDLVQRDHELTLTITDNGVGFAQENQNQKKTLGILGMKERTAIIGGTYEIKSIPGMGTRISVMVPLGKKPISS